MKETQQQIDLRNEAIAFAEWIRYSDIYPVADGWCYLGARHTTDELYRYFKQEQP